jgi:hypothetical protein
MTCSTSSSARAALAALALGLLGACAGSRPSAPAAAAAAPERPPPRILVLPLENLSGGAAPLRDLAIAVEVAVASRGVEVITGDLLEAFLAKYRIRNTGGLDRAAARAARDDLGADGVLVTTLESYSENPPRLSLVMRLISTGGDPAVSWIDGFSRSGDDRPGLFGMGFVGTVEALRGEALEGLTASLADFLAGKAMSGRSCPGGGWFRPRVAYRGPVSEAGARTVVVLPFLNETRRRGSGELIALTFVRELATAGGFQVLEPGIVRDQLLRYRVVMEGGVSVDQARSMLNALDGDYVMAGTVFAFDDSMTLPSATFSALVIERKTGRIVWDSTSYNKGDDAESLFGLNRVSTVSALTCRMARNVVEALAGRQPLPPRP